MFIVQPRDDSERLQNINASLDSGPCFTLAAGWLADCIAKHSECNSSVSDRNWFPTRLIDVGSYGLESGSEALLRLHILSDHGPPKGPYMTLSHCWESAKFMRLMQPNLDRMKTGFAVEDLPKTFRDAVYIVRRLGIRYLWIDSLCIQQDSVEDWEHEAAMMGDVYENALCNIAATGSSNSDEGCLRDRENLLVRPCIITSNWERLQGKTYSIVDLNFWKANMTGAPLNRRAWVVQERLLALRVLHFGRTQLLWECHELDACETFPRGIPSDLADMYTRFKNMDPADNGRRLRSAYGTDPDPVLDAHQLWCKIVKAYMACDLSHHEDKLIALSGLAKKMQVILKDEYFAGMWGTVLPSQLLWTVSACQQANGRPSCRPIPYRAPSWSWASVDGDIYPGESSREGIMITILNSEIIPVNSNLTGRIKGGSLLIQGTLCAGQLYLAMSSNSVHLVVNKQDLGPECRVSLDVDSEDLKEEVHCLPIHFRGPSFYRDAGYPEDFSPSILGLILRSARTKNGIFRRIGSYWQQSVLDVYETSSQCHLTII
ncbi:hypothetical protein MMC22_009840 [Lobaria immixta]|nr:hypothetical protein [Lobaria immixta]